MLSSATFQGLSVVATPSAPKTNFGKILKSVNESLNHFTDYWFGRDARKTNDGLIEFSSDLFLLCSLESDVSILGAARSIKIVRIVQKYNERSLKSIFRLCPSKDDAHNNLKKEKQNIISKWAILTRYFGPDVISLPS